MDAIKLWRFRELKLMLCSGISCVVRSAYFVVIDDDRGSVRGANQR